MPLLNYTTEVPAIKSIGEICAKLVTHDARSIMTNYSASHDPESISFTVLTKQGEIAFRLPANVAKVEALKAKAGK